MEEFMYQLYSKSTLKLRIRIHDFNQNQAPSNQINIQGFAVGNGCTDQTECEFQNDYGPYLMRLYRDYGFITEIMFD